MRSIGSLTIVDSASALSFIFILIVATFTHLNPPTHTLAVEIGYYQKVAEQILLISAMKGYVKELICDLETGRALIPTLTKIAELCPDELACRLCIYNKAERILNSFGTLNDSTYGEARYFTTLKQGIAVVVCQVSTG